MKRHTKQKAVFVAAILAANAVTARAQAPPPPREANGAYTAIKEANQIRLTSPSQSQYGAPQNGPQLVNPNAEINVNGCVYPTGYGAAPQAVVVRKDIDGDSVHLKKGDVFFPLSTGDLAVVHGKDVTVQGSAGTQLTGIQTASIGVLAKNAKDQCSEDRSPSFVYSPYAGAYGGLYNGGLYNGNIVLAVGPMVTFGSPFYNGYNGGGRVWFPFSGHGHGRGGPVRNPVPVRQPRNNLHK